MVVRWKQRRIETTARDYLWGFNYSAEIFRSYRNSEKKPRQKYIATLGSFSVYDVEGGNVIKDGASLVRFWTSAWKKLHNLEFDEKELEKIMEKLTKETDDPPTYCLWSPPGYTFSEWSGRLWNSLGFGHRFRAHFMRGEHSPEFFHLA